MTIVADLADTQGTAHPSYNTLDEFMDYLERVDYELANPTPIPAGFDDTLTHILWRSAVLIDSYPYTGTKHSESQPLAFGRDGLEKNGVALPTNKDFTPEDIFNANLAIAAEIRRNPAFARTASHNAFSSSIKSVKGGNTEVVFRDGLEDSETGRSTHAVQNNFINSLIIPYTIHSNADTGVGSSLTFDVDRDEEQFGGNTDRFGYIYNNYNRW